MKKIILYIKFIRVKHWIKNGFLFIPLVFSNNLFNTQALLQTMIAFLGFSFASSIIYIVNDVKDLEIDRKNPTKQDRPLVNNSLNKKDIILLLFLMISGLVTVSQYINAKAIYIYIIISYIILNLLYCFYLKNISIIDVLCIALGFVLRVICGAVVISVVPSQWILLVTFVLSLYLGFGKRLREFMLESSSKRNVMQFYNEQMLWSFINISTALFLSAYINYTIELTPIWNKSYYLSFMSILFLIMGVFRYHFTLCQNDSTGDPTDALWKDPYLWISGICYSGIMLWVLY